MQMMFNSDALESNGGSRSTATAEAILMRAAVRAASI